MKHYGDHAFVENIQLFIQMCPYLGVPLKAFDVLCTECDMLIIIVKNINIVK